MDLLLHPTDFSTNSDQAFLVACSIARDQNGRVIVLHVVNPTECAPGDLKGNELDPESDLSLKIKSQFDYLRSLTYDVPLSFQIKLGDMLQTVIDVATHEHCDMIVLAGRNRKGEHYQAHGCISEGLIRHAPCSVLVLRHFHADSALEPVPEQAVETCHDRGSEHPEPPPSVVLDRNW